MRMRVGTEKEKQLLGFQRFFEDYVQYTQKEYQKSETYLLSVLMELAEGYSEWLAIVVDDEISIDNQTRHFQFELTIEDNVNQLNYIGWSNG